MLMEVAYTPITASASPPPNGPRGGTCPQANLAAYSRNGGPKPGAGCWPCAFASPATKTPSSNTQVSGDSLLCIDIWRPPQSACCSKPAFAAPALGCGSVSPRSRVHLKHDRALQRENLTLDYKSNVCLLGVRWVTDAPRFLAKTSRGPEAGTIGSPCHPRLPGR
jgi:hypothetical protein